MARSVFYKVRKTLNNSIKDNRSTVLQYGTNVTFLTLFTTSFFEKRQKLNVSFAASETQNCRDETPPCPNPPPPFFKVDVHVRLHFFRLILCVKPCETHE